MNLKAQLEIINSWLKLLPSTHGKVAQSFFEQVTSIPELEEYTISNSTITVECGDSDKILLTFCESLKDTSIRLSPEQIECLYTASLSASIRFNQTQLDALRSEAPSGIDHFIAGLPFIEAKILQTSLIKKKLKTINLYFSHLGYAPRDINDGYEHKFDIFNPSEEVEKISLKINGFSKIGEEASESNTPKITQLESDDRDVSFAISIKPHYARHTLSLKVTSTGQLNQLEKIAIDGIRRLKTFYAQMELERKRLDQAREASTAALLHGYNATIDRLSSLSLSVQAEPVNSVNEDKLRACLESLNLQTKKVISFSRKPGARYIEVEPAKRTQIAEALKQSFGDENVRLAGDSEKKFIQVSGKLLDLLERPHSASGSAAAAGANAGS